MSNVSAQHEGTRHLWVQNRQFSDSLTGRIHRASLETQSSPLKLYNELPNRPKTTQPFNHPLSWTLYSSPTKGQGPDIQEETAARTIEHQIAIIFCDCQFLRSSIAIRFAIAIYFNYHSKLDCDSLRRNLIAISPKTKAPAAASPVGQRTAPASCFLQVVHTKVPRQSPRRAKEVRRACEAEKVWCHPAAKSDGARKPHFASRQIHAVTYEETRVSCRADETRPLPGSQTIHGSHNPGRMLAVQTSLKRKPSATTFLLEHLHRNQLQGEGLPKHRSHQLLDLP